jgi:hypothetical protein
VSRFSSSSCFLQPVLVYAHTSRHHIHVQWALSTDHLGISAHALRHGLRSAFGVAFTCGLSSKGGRKNKNDESDVHICRSAKKRVVTYSVLFIIYFYFFIGF